MKISAKKLQSLIKSYLNENKNDDSNYGAEDHEVFIEPHGIVFRYPDGEEEVLELEENYNDETSAYDLIKMLLSGKHDIDGDLTADAYGDLLSYFIHGADNFMTKESFDKFGSNKAVVNMMIGFMGDKYEEFIGDDRRFVDRAKKLEKLKKLNLPADQQKPYFQIGESKYYLDSYRVKYFKTSEGKEINRGFKDARINVVGIRDSSGFLFSLEKNGQLTKRVDIYVAALQVKSPIGGVYVHYKNSGRRFYKQGEDFFGLGVIDNIGIDQN